MDLVAKDDHLQDLISSAYENAFNCCCGCGRRGIPLMDFGEIENYLRDMNTNPGPMCEHNFHMRHDDCEGPQPINGANIPAAAHELFRLQQEYARISEEAWARANARGEK